MIPWFTDTINIMMVWFKKFQFQAYYFKDFGAPPQPPPLFVVVVVACVLLLLFLLLLFLQIHSKLTITLTVSNGHWRRGKIIKPGQHWAICVSWQWHTTLRLEHYNLPIFKFCISDQYFFSFFKKKKMNAPEPTLELSQRRAGPWLRWHLRSSAEWHMSHHWGINLNCSAIFCKQ